MFPASVKIAVLNIVNNITVMQRGQYVAAQQASRRMGRGSQSCVIMPYLRESK